MFIKRKIVPVIAVALAFGLFAGPSLADSDDRDEPERKSRGSAVSGKAVPESALYKQECSSCHFLYQPWLLPARSWKALVDDSDRHFGDNLALDEETRKELAAYLTANSSEKSGLKWARKITSSSEGMTPKRIMDVPWVRKEHREVEAAFKRPSVKSASNCGACHIKGAEGNYDEDFVKVPRN